MKYVCTGHIQPERASVSFSSFEFRMEKIGRVTVGCDSSQLTVVLHDQEIDGWIAAKIISEDVAGMVTGALGFALGSGYSVEILQVVDPDGVPHVFGIRPSGDTPTGTLGWDPHLDVFNRALRLAMHDVFFRLAVRDYLRAIASTTDCATYCYRAIEGIKSAFVFETGQDRWDDMHAALGTDKVRIVNLVKVFADPIRHGNWISSKPTDKVQRWKMLCLTRDILSGYLDYRGSPPATNAL